MDDLPACIRLWPAIVDAMAVECDASVTVSQLVFARMAAHVVRLDLVRAGRLRFAFPSTPSSPARFLPLSVLAGAGFEESDRSGIGVPLSCM